MTDLIKSILNELANEKNIDKETIQVLLDDYEKHDNMSLSSKLVEMIEKKYVENKTSQN